MEAQGRNLLDVNALFGDQPSNFNINNDGTITVFAGDGRAWSALNSISLTAGKYIFYRTNSSCPASATVYGQDGSVVMQKNVGTQDNPTLLNVPADGTLKVRLGYQASSFPVTTGLMLNKGDHAIPYEPYYHSTTPIPLPSRGWVAGLPDGTADVLTLDGAGKVVWEEATDKRVLDGSVAAAGYVLTEQTTGLNETIVRVAYNPYMLIGAAGIYIFMSDRFIRTPRQAYSYYYVWGSNSAPRMWFAFPPDSVTNTSEVAAWFSDHPTTVLYPLATPVTEQLGYVDLPEIPDGATITIPELDSLNVKYVVSAATLISGHESRIAALEAAVAELIAGA